MKTLLNGTLVFALTGFAWAGPADKSIDTILNDYFVIQSALADDTVTGIDKAAQSIHQTAASTKVDDPEINALVSEIKAASWEIQGKDLEAARAEFFKLSKPLLVYLSKFHSDNSGYHRFFCPMAQKGWIQSETGTRNPYYGSSMLSCGERIE